MNPTAIQNRTKTYEDYNGSSMLKAGHSFHMSANSSVSNGFVISCIFLLVLALTFFAYLPAFCLFSNERIYHRL
ncbi:hypothetical protein Hanom_Chr00s004858g01725841 [Helianthus anomalus]